LLQPEQGLAALALAAVACQQKVPQQPTVLAAVPILWSTFLSRMKQPADCFFAKFLPAGSQEVDMIPEEAGAAVAAATAPALAQSPPAAVDAAAMEDQVQAAVADAVEDLLGEQVSPDEPLMAAGLDSLGAVELRNKLQEDLQVNLPNTLVFDYPTQQALTSYITTQMLASAAAMAATAAAAASPMARGLALTNQRNNQTSLQPAAASVNARPGSHVVAEGNDEYSYSTGALVVLGASQRSPGTVQGPVELQAMRGDSGDAVGLVPLTRWDVEATPATSTSARWEDFSIRGLPFQTNILIF
jgi:acyl carrier protein